MFIKRLLFSVLFLMPFHGIAKTKKHVSDEAVIIGLFAAYGAYVLYRIYTDPVEKKAAQEAVGDIKNKEEQSAADSSLAKEISIDVIEEKVAKTVEDIDIKAPSTHQNILSEPVALTQEAKFVPDAILISQEVDAEDELKESEINLLDVIKNQREHVADSAPEVEPTTCSTCVTKS